MNRARGWTGLARTGCRVPWAYRADALTGLVSMAARIVLFTLVWRAIYRGQHSVAGVDERTAVAYAILAQVTNAVVNPWPGESIASRVRQGLIGIDLLRPYSLVEQTIVGQLGRAAARLPEAVVGLVVGLALGGLIAPPDVGAALVFPLSLAFAVAVGQLLTFLVSMLAFWTLEIGGPLMVYGMVSTFLAGGLVPLWLMPGWLRFLAEWLPFQAATFTPVAIYTGRPPGGLLAALSVQALWIAVLCGLCGWVWARARYRVVVQGG